jgi:hypothetical protein
MASNNTAFQDAEELNLMKTFVADKDCTQIKADMFAKYSDNRTKRYLIQKIAWGLTITVNLICLLLKIAWNISPE